MLATDVNIAVPKQPSAIGILAGQDLAVAAWTWQHFNLQPMLINRAFGLTEDGNLIGSIIFREWNGYNVEFSVHGKGVLTPGVIRCMARFALETFNVERVTLRTWKSNRRLRKQYLKFGAQFEGVLECFYGRERTSATAAVQYMIHREVLLRLAGLRYKRAKMN